MANLYDDSDDDSLAPADYNPMMNDQMQMNPSQRFGGYSGQPSMGAGISYGAASSFGGGGASSMFGGGQYNDPLSMGGGMGYGQAASYGDVLSTDYVDLSKVKAPEIKQHQPNKYATSSKSSLKKPGKKKDEPRGVSFGDVETFHIEKQSNATASDKKSKSDADEDDSFGTDEDDIENEALTKNATTDDVKQGVIANMLKKIADLGESVTESGSLGLKKSIDSANDDYKMSSSGEELNFKKPMTNASRNKSPSGLSSSGEDHHLKSADNEHKTTSEYDSAELSRNFNYEESEELARSKQKSDRSRKSNDDTEYDDDEFESTSHLHESSSMGAKTSKFQKQPEVDQKSLKSSDDKFDDIEDIRKRSNDYKSKMDAFNSNFKSQLEHEDDISLKDSSPRTSDLRKSPLDEPSYKQAMRASKNDDIRIKSLEYDNEELAREKYNAEMDAKVSMMEGHNHTEANKRKQEKVSILGYIADIKTYRIEIEGLKRQLDNADYNALTKQEEIDRLTEEYESKLRLTIEKHKNTQERAETKEMSYLKREIANLHSEILVLKDTHEQDTKRCDKLEEDNFALRANSKAIRDAETKAKHYQDEVHTLRMRLVEAKKAADVAPVSQGSNYNNWTKDQLIRELMSIDRAVERFTKENETFMLENKRQKSEIHELNSLLHKESSKLEDYKHKMIKESGSVMVVDDEKQLNLKALNGLGINHAITQQDLKELRNKLYAAEKAKNDIEQEYTVKTVDYKAQIDIIRQERIEAERKMIGLDSALKTQISVNQTAQTDHSMALDKLQTERDEAVKKLEWYMENQDMLDDDQEKLKYRDQRISELKEEISNLKANDSGRSRVNQLEKQIRELQEALAKKNPDSVSMLLKANKPSVEEQAEYKVLKSEVTKLRQQLEDKDEEFERKLRNLRSESDKMKTKYEKSKARPVPEDVKDQRIEDLERQVQDTKEYYQARLKNVETLAPKSDKKTAIKEEMHLLGKIKDLMKDNEKLKKLNKTTQKKVKVLESKNQDPGADLVKATEALINDDYSFTLINLYKKVQKINNQLSNSSLDEAFKGTEAFIDKIDKASQQNNNNRAVIMFTKITRKCVELSEVVEAGIDRTNKPKVTLIMSAIEDLLKAEIDHNNTSKVAQKPKTDLNLDFEIDESVGLGSGQPAKNSNNTIEIDEEEEDGYWSDFSDDDYTQEVKEERKALEIISSLQNWVFNSNLEQHLQNKYSSDSVITLDQLKRALSSCGYYTELFDLQALLKRLEITSNKGVDYEKLLLNIGEQSSGYWKKQIKNNSFDLSYKGEGNMRALCSKPISTFIQNNLPDVALQAANKAGYLTTHEFITTLFGKSSKLSKSNLRKALLSNGLYL